MPGHKQPKTRRVSVLCPHCGVKGGHHINQEAPVGMGHIRKCGVCEGEFMIRINRRGGITTHTSEDLGRGE